MQATQSNNSVGGRTQIQLDIETRDKHSISGIVSDLIEAHPETRNEVKEIINRHDGFFAYVGGCHVAVLTDSSHPQRVILVTGTAPDFN